MSASKIAGGTLNSLGAISTLFKIKGDAAKEVLSRVDQLGSEPVPITDSTSVKASEIETSESENLFENIETRANELLEDQIVKLDWEQMQELVAEILVAMGFKTEVSRQRFHLVVRTEVLIFLLPVTVLV